MKEFGNVTVVANATPSGSYWDARIDATVDPTGGSIMSVEVTVTLKNGSTIGPDTMDPNGLNIYFKEHSQIDEPDFATVTAQVVSAVTGSDSF